MGEDTKNSGDEEKESFLNDESVMMSEKDAHS